MKRWIETERGAAMIEFNRKTETYQWCCEWGCTDYDYDTRADAEWGFSDHMCFGRLA